MTIVQKCIIIHTYRNCKLENMKKYIAKILEGKSINYNAFIKSAQKLSISVDEIREVFHILHDKKSNYFFEINNQERYEVLFSRFLDENDDQKITAALHGNSKLSKIAYGMLNFKFNYNDTNGVLIMFSEQCFDFEINKKKLVIIENLNNFADIQSNFSDLDLEQFNFIWGKGNEIASVQYVQFLAQYDEIICFFDYDLGGLKAFKSLHNHLGNKVKFYIPTNFDSYINRYGKPINQEQYFKLIHDYNDVEPLTEIIAILVVKKKFLEQETIQHNME